MTWRKTSLGWIHYADFPPAIARNPIACRCSWLATRWLNRQQVSMAADPNASIALPFTPRPENLNGELVGDVGFDPLNFSEEVRKIRISTHGLVFNEVSVCSQMESCVAGLTRVFKHDAVIPYWRDRQLCATPTRCMYNVFHVPMCSLCDVWTQHTKPTYEILRAACYGRILLYLVVPCSTNMAREHRSTGGPDCKLVDPILFIRPIADSILAHSPSVGA